MPRTMEPLARLPGGARVQSPASAARNPTPGFPIWHVGSWLHLFGCLNIRRHQLHDSYLHHGGHDVAHPHHQHLVPPLKVLDLGAVRELPQPAPRSIWRCIPRSTRCAALQQARLCDIRRHRRSPELAPPLQLGIQNWGPIPWNCTTAKTIDPQNRALPMCISWLSPLLRSALLLPMAGILLLSLVVGTGPLLASEAQPHCPSHRHSSSLPTSLRLCALLLSP